MSVNLDIDDFAKEHYFWELKRRTELNEAVTIPLGLISAIGGAMVFYFDAFLKALGMVQSHLTLATFIGVSLTAGLFVVGIGVVCLIRSRVYQKYRYIPTVKQIVDHYAALREHYNDTTTAESATKLFIRERYAVCSDHNCKNNDFRANLIGNAYLALVWSIIPLVLLTICYLIVRVAGRA